MLVGKFGASACFAILFIYTAELYPTEVRSTALGIPSTFSRISGIIAPFVVGLRGPLPYIIFGIPAIIGGILAIFLPETLGSELPTTLEQVTNTLGGDGWLNGFFYPKNFLELDVMFHS